jgi:hypothetical protein
VLLEMLLAKAGIPIKQAQLPFIRELGAKRLTGVGHALLVALPALPAINSLFEGAHPIPGVAGDLGIPTSCFPVLRLPSSF